MNDDLNLNITTAVDNLMQTIMAYRGRVDAFMGVASYEICEEPELEDLAQSWSHLSGESA